jgi:cobalt-zinc-cadmium efflux system outer membrane protein
MRLRIAAVMACAVTAAPVHSQITPLSRAVAVQTALERGARLGVPAADTAVARAALITARTLPNPNFSAGYSKSVPQYHFGVDIPFSLPYRRSLAERSATYALQASEARYLLARVSVVLDADTMYTHALAAREHLALSRRAALDADSILHMAERRRDAGDASELDVTLARVAAGQQENIASADSLTYFSVVLDLEATLGIATPTGRIEPTDSLVDPPGAAEPSLTLNEAAANLSVASAAFAVRHEHRSIWSTPSLSLGFEYGDPTHSEPGILPTFGLGFVVPFFDRNRGGIAQAEAEHARALAELTLARVEARNEINHAIRERNVAVARVARDRLLLTSANSVARMALTAYQEGQSTLPSVLEAQRTARDVLSQYIDDLANAWIATAELRALATPVPPAYAISQPSPGTKP